VCGVSSGQISLLIQHIFASFWSPAAVMALYYAEPDSCEFRPRLLGVRGAPFLLPSMTKSFADKTSERVFAAESRGLRLKFLLALPCAGGAALLACALISTLFHHGVSTGGTQ